MSFGSGGFSGFGQQNQQSSTGFGGFGSNTQSGGAFGSTTSGFGSNTAQQSSGGGLFGSSTGGGFGSTGGGFGSGTGGAFGAKPAFGSTTTTAGGGLFGSSTTATAGGSGFGSGGFGSQTTSSSTPFGGGSSLFGGNKTTTFGGTGTTGTTGTSLFGGGSGTTGGFGSGSTGFGATSNPGIGTNVGDPPGTAQVQFQPTVEKEANNPSQSNSFQNILFMEPYKKWSAEELRLADYNQGRRHGNASGSTGAFGVSSGFGSGGFGSTGSGFGNTGTTTTTGTGLFGGSQPASTGFGQTGATSGFGSGTSGGLFGQQNKPAGTGLFGATSQPQQTNSLFGSSSTGGGFGTATTGTGFGSGTTTGTGGTGLFGSTATQAKPSGFSFGTGGAQTSTGFGSTGTTGGFGGTSGTTTGTGTGLFGGGGTQTTGSSLFGGTGQTGTTSTFGGGFGAQNQQQQQQGSSLFGGAQQQKPAAGLFGGTGTAGTGTSLFGGTGQTQSPFGGGQTTQPSNSLFGAKPAGATGTSLFGGAGTTQTGATGTGLFGGLGGAAQTQQQPAAQTGGLFGNAQAKPSLFGGSTQPAGSGLFGTQTAQPQSSLFGGTATQQQPQAANSLFGASQGVQNTPQSLTTSINDVSAFGTPSLFQGLGAGEVRDPGPLATPLSGSTTKTPRRGSILPLYKLNPGSASKFVTPSKRGFGFSYSNFGTPTSPSSAASTPGGFGQSLLMGGNRGLSKSISTSSLRRSFNPEDSILAPGAFSSTSGPKYHTNTGSVKRLVINREIRSDLFSTPNKDKQAAELTNGSRKLSKRVSFDTTTVPAIENGVADVDAVEEQAQDMGFIRPSSRTGNNVNGSRPSSSDANPEMEQVKGNELAIVHEEGSPTVTKTVEPPKATGEYWMRPSMEEINEMNRMQRQQVSDFTVGRKGIGQIRFKVPVDLSNINIEEIPGGIVLLETRSATVYPVSAKKPPMGKGLNVPSEISLEHSWPRGRVHEKSGPRVTKHVERLKKIDNTTFINYDAETGVWTFSVEHFTTYGLDYDEEDEETEAQVDTQEPDELPALPPHQPVQTFASPEVDPDDTFDFRRNRRAVPGAFDDEAMSDEEVVPKQQSFLSSGSAEYASRAVVPVIADDEEMDHDDVALENEDMAISTFQPHHPAEPQATSPHLGSTMIPDTPAGIVRARMRAIKESATPLKLQVAGGDDWMDMLRRTVSPQKRDRAALRALSEVEPSESVMQEKAPVTRNRVVSDGRGFATSIDLMNSLFEKAKAPTPAAQTITPAKGFIKWPYKKAKQPENEADMDPADRSFYDSFKPSWAPDGAFLIRNNTFGGFSDGVGVVKSSAFTGDFPVENPLDGIADHRDLVDIHLVNGVPTVSTQRVPHLKAFSALRSAAHRNQSDRLDSISRNMGAYEQSVWELASVLFDPIDHAVNAQEEKRIRKVNLCKYWRGVVQDAFTKNLDRAFTAEEKAVAYLSANKVAEACKQLSDAKDLKLGTLVALIGTSDTFQKDMREQVEEWHDGDVLSEFTMPIRTIYSLLGGNVTECKGKKGSGVENRLDTENIAERFGLNWKQAFGLRLWYGISSGDDIATAVEKFLGDVEHGSVPAPQPWYVEQGLQSGYEDNNINRREDLLWGLLKVFAERAKLEDILQPESSQLAPFNYRLCWQLSQALSVKNKRLFGDKAETKADALTVSFATEVLYYKQPGSWVAAIWVLLHLSDPAARAKAVQDVLNRNAASLFTRESRELNYHDRIMEDMKIPAAWFWQAAALHWRSRQDHPALEAQCLLKAHAFADAHKIFVKELAPRAVVARDYASAVIMLARFQPHRQSIPEWALGGEVYGHFFELLAERGNSKLSPQLVEALMSSLPAMYEACRENDTTEVAAITEMADVVAREAMELAGKGRMDLSKISRLPLTEDRHLRYSSDLASAYYREVMSARG